MWRKIRNASCNIIPILIPEALITVVWRPLFPEPKNIPRPALWFPDLIYSFHSTLIEWAFSLFLVQTNFILTSGSLYWLFFLPGMLFPQSFQASSFILSGLHSNHHLLRKALLQYSKVLLEVIARKEKGSLAYLVNLTYNIKRKQETPG